MAGYTPVFDSVYAGTLCGRWPTTAVWVTLLPLCDKHGHIDLSHQAICALTGWPLDLLQQGIAELMKPDADSRSPLEEGRRLVLLDPEHRSWGWRVVNHGIYREKARKLQYDNERTASGRDAQRKKESREVPTPPAKSREVPLSDADADADADADKDKTPLRGAPVAQERDGRALTVFAHWQQEWKHPSSKLDAKRKKRIEARLKDFTPEQLCDAISGFRHSDWHTGQDPKGNGTVYDSLDTLLRDTGQVEKGLQLFAHPPRPPPKQLSPVERARAKLESVSNGNGRVVSEQFGGAGDGGLEAPAGLLRRIPDS